MANEAANKGATANKGKGGGRTGTGKPKGGGAGGKKGAADKTPTQAADKK